MVWKEPKDRDENPWRRNVNQHKNSESNNDEKNHDQGPPDLDEIFRKLRKKLGNLGKNKNLWIRSSSRKKSFFYTKSRLVSVVISITIIIWIASGFYTIKEAEKGVVTRFGKFIYLVEPGLNWKPTFIDNVTVVNVESVRELTTSNVMLTSDENIVCVEMNVQYRINDPRCYLFNVNNTDDSLRQATDSALHNIIGKYNMNSILNKCYTIIRNDIRLELEEIIRPYNMGVILLDVNFQSTHPPEEVKAYFEDTVVARENEKQYIHEAEVYANEVQPHANSKAHRLLEEARAYRTKTILEAQGEVARFAKILPEYKVAPKIIRERLYIKTMEKVLSHTRKILLSENKNDNLIVLPLNQVLKNNNTITEKNDKKKIENSLHLPSMLTTKNNVDNISSKDHNDIMDQRRINAQRNNYQR